MSFESGKPLNFRCTCHGRSPAQNRSISRNERPDTLDPCIKSIRLSNVKLQLPSFPFGCYTNPYTYYTTALGLYQLAIAGTPSWQNLHSTSLLFLPFAEPLHRL